MMRTRLYWKIYASYVALILVASAAVWLVAARVIEQDSIAILKTALRNKALFLKEIAPPALEQESAKDLLSRIKALGSETQTRLTVIRADGRVAADSMEDPAIMENHADRPEIAAARERGEGDAIRYSKTLGTRMMYVAVAIREAGQLAGYARAALALTVVDAQKASLRRLAAGTALGAALFALAIGLALAKRISEPVGVMTAMAERVARGDFSLAVPDDGTDGGDEIKRLGKALNQMALELKERMDKTEKERNELQAILNGMSEGVVALDREERVTHINQAAAQILDIEPEGCLGKPFWEATRISQLVQRVSDSVVEGMDIREEILIPGPKQDRVVVSSITPLLDARREQAGAIAVLHDISALRRLEEVRKDFVANVSHEMKTPLTAVLGLIETVLDDPKMPQDTLARFLIKVRGQVMRLTAIVQDLLTLSRVESGEETLEVRPLDLLAPVLESAQAFKTLAEEKKLALECSVPPGPLAVHGEKELLRQVVDNLLDNAVKYTPEGGRVWLRLKTEGEWAVLEIQDTGIGIDPRSQERVFERFYRVDKARSRELGGTGLGLSIVRNTVVRLGGEVSVESHLGAGSLFRVRLPLAASN